MNESLKQFFEALDKATALDRNVGQWSSKTTGTFTERRLAWAEVRRLRDLLSAEPEQTSGKVIAYRIVCSETGNPRTDWIDGSPSGTTIFSNSKYQLAYDQPALQSNIPEGWKLVPIEVTPEQIARLSQFDMIHSKRPHQAEYVREMYSALLQSAPATPEQPALPSYTGVMA